MLVSLYTSLPPLLTEFRRNEISVETIRSGLKFSENLLNEFKQNPDIIAAQPLFYKSKLSYIENLTFNTCVYLMLLCNANRINEICTQQLISGILSIYAKQSDALESFLVKGKSIVPPASVQSKALYNQLGKHHQHIWQSLIQISLHFLRLPKTTKAWPMNLSKMQQLAYLAHFMSVLITLRENQKPKSFAEVIKLICLKCPAQWSEYLENLLDYPTSIPSGSVIKHKSGSKTLTLSTSHSKILGADLSVGSANAPSMLNVDSQGVNRVYAAQKVAGLAQIEKWWNTQWLEIYTKNNYYAKPHTAQYKLNKPPAVLLEVQEHLNSDNVDIDKLARQISEEPYFADYLKQTASVSNRNKLPIQRVKHGLMMHGYERTNSLLIQQLLLTRLNQHYFPLQQDFIQFTRLRGQIASTLAESTNVISGENASVLVCFSTAGLFTQPNIKSHTKWRRNPQEQYNIANLFTSVHNDNLLTHAVKLAQAWQQSEFTISCLQQQKKSPTQFTEHTQQSQVVALMGLSLIGAIHVFFAQNSIDNSTNEYKNQALDAIGLEENVFIAATNHALSTCHTYRSI